MPRKYTKKSSYWNKFDKKELPIEELSSASEPDTAPVLAGETFYSEGSSYNRNVEQITETASNGRIYKRSPSKKKCEKFKNIDNCGLPYSYKDAYITPRRSILLCQKAYANIPIFRNAVDVMSEFANSDIFLEGGSEKSKKFVTKWLDKIQSWKIKDQYFREFYRSGNIFIYKIDGNFSAQEMIKLNQVYGSDISIAAESKIPLKYIFLNPYDFVATRATTFSEKNGAYKKILSEYDIERLKNPKNTYDQEVYDALPDKVKEKIENTSYNLDGISVDLDPDKLLYSFYKKQDYEPFAIPFGFPVLDDINWKMELKKVDQAISRTVENVILLITMGNEPDKGGINPNNLKAMQQLFMNESVGRALIADYTTKADFIIPDLNKVLGPNKYQIVNEDIRDGLQNIIVGKENYSSTQVKAQIFLERLKEARNAFINDFLQPQIKQVCKSVGLKNYPTAKFVEIDIKDEVQLQRVASRLIEMGIITPEQGMTAIKKGIYPNPEELYDAQEKLVEERKQGHYTPLAAAQPILAEEDQQMKEEQHDAQIEQIEQNIKTQKQQPAAKPNVPGEEGRPAGTKTKTNVTANQDLYSRKDIQEVIYATESLREEAIKIVKKHHNKKRMSAAHKELVNSLVESVVLSSPPEQWTKTVEACVKDINKIEKLDIIPEILDLSEEHGLEQYPSALLYHSDKISKK
tara:strand:+ start:357 stop:2426 length:2070 start_codon:yes stop_codon:yes gene_type:complete